MTVWEYLVRDIPLNQEALTALGAERWELVGFCVVGLARSFAQEYHYVFKRPKREEAPYR